MPEIPLAFRKLELFYRDKERVTFCGSGQRQQSVIPSGMFHGVRIQHVANAFDQRDAAPGREYQQRDNERPEIQLLAMSKWMTRIGRLGREPFADAQGGLSSNTSSDGTD